MPPALVPLRERRPSVPPTRPLAPLLLAATGLALVGAGALLGSERGAFVAFGDGFAAVLAWCF